MDDLVTWLRAQLDEDERVAQAAADTRAFWDHESPGERWINNSADGVDGAGVPVFLSHAGMPTTQVAAHIARHDPARVLREVAAKRAIIDMWLRDNEYSTGEDSLRHLAAVYSDRDGYRPEWTPDPSG